MAVKTCEFCGSTYSDKGRGCPGCGKILLENAGRENLSREIIERDLKAYGGGIKDIILLIVAFLLFIPAIPVFAYGVIPQILYFDTKYKVMFYAIFGLIVFFMEIWLVVKQIIKYKKIKAATDFDNYTVKTDTLLNVREGFKKYRRRHCYEEPYRYTFKDSGEFRSLVDHKHFKWSKNYKMTNKQLFNRAIIGDEYYIVIAQVFGKKNEILAIYPKKFFEITDLGLLNNNSNNTEKYTLN